MSGYIWFECRIPADESPWRFGEIRFYHPLHGENTTFAKIEETAARHIMNTQDYKNKWHPAGILVQFYPNADRNVMTPIEDNKGNILYYRLDDKITPVKPEVVKPVVKAGVAKPVIKDATIKPPIAKVQAAPAGKAPGAVAPKVILKKPPK